MHFVITPDSDFLTESCLVRLLLIDRLKKITLFVYCLSFPVVWNLITYLQIPSSLLFHHYLGCDMVLMDALDISS